MKIIFKPIVFFLLLFVISCNYSSKTASDQIRVRNIIFMVGDGLGDAQLFAAMTIQGSALYLEQFPFSGFQKTYSLVNYITDSAASGTALATGQKTKNGILGQDTAGNHLKSILKIAQANGLSTGLVSTSSITHATPAAFYANQPSRYLDEEIAADLLKTDIDVFIAGGYNAFADREDGLNLIDTLKARGYFVTRSMAEVRNVTSGKLAGFTAEVHNPKYTEGREEMLSDAVSKAIELLNENKNGFFLMVEGSMIDWGGHESDLDYIVEETLDFDRAVGRALDFARKDGNTLVVVTSDHETGGMTLLGGSIDSRQVSASFSTDGHTASMVPVFSFGPGAERFSGIIDNTKFFRHIMELYGFTVGQ